MNGDPPSITIIIAARPGQKKVQALAASQLLDYPPDKIQILVARGTHPSVQRNTALRAATGEIIYFLDDDSVPGDGNLWRIAGHFRDPAVQMVGGPNLCPRGAPRLEQVFALVLASWLAFGPSRARYWRVGKIRATSEKELILCNLAARREPLTKLGGFNEALYPNEENALMDELQKQGGKLLYDPDLVVHRRPRSSLESFARMLRTYGRGRAEQFRVHPTPGSALNFVPPLFLLYLVILPLAAWQLGPITLVPLVLYGLAVLGQTVALALEASAAGALAALPLIILTHILYGYGFWRGLFTPLTAPGQGEKPAIEVVIENFSPRPPRSSLPLD